MKDKQIEEMATIICQNTEFDTMWGECYQSAKALYNAGYRKASAVAREIFEEIAAIPMRNMPYAVYLNFHNKIAELKKKYTEGVNENTK